MFTTQNALQIAWVIRKTYTPSTSPGERQVIASLACDLAACMYPDTPNTPDASPQRRMFLDACGIGSYDSRTQRNSH